MVNSSAKSAPKLHATICAVVHLRFLAAAAAAAACAALCSLAAAFLARSRSRSRSARDGARACEEEEEE
jgi:hypothetical protein